MSRPVPAPHWTLVYDGVDITRDILGDVISVTYTDKLHGESDDLEVEIEDRDGRWRGPWYPGKGDTLNAEVGLEPGVRVPAGRFKIEELTFAGRGQGDTVTIRALAAAITRDLRTRRSKAYEGVTLRTIVDRIAARHDLEVVGDVAHVPFDRVSQDDESDLAFLKRIAETHGHAATVRGEQLVFQELDGLRGAKVVTRLARPDLTSYRLDDQGERIYKAATVAYQDPGSKELVEHTVQAEGVESGDTLKAQVRAENPAQAERKAKALLDRRNRRKVAGSLRVDARPTLVAGVKLGLTGMAKLSGPYLVTQSRHKLDRGGGYVTDLEVERV